ncbi:MAG TPA: hypothetical protein VHL31_20665 [Geminicoccus sp.]|jgi:hypothetical protein|uniref:hypothetical protein n=1 Tax=Geminicoccus sp. TaxID=2024832 RepID=UPI002E309B59|nr:hypothetical protein [Geminicoccus sp.]HEX2528694.1 hypothetical protein [Geminicoccus sp.]
MQKSNQNVLAVSAAVYTGIGGPLTAVLQLLGYVEQATTIRNAVVFVTDTTWNWTAFYIAGFIVSMSWIISTNIRLFSSLLHRRKARHSGYFDTPLSDAVRYMVEKSAFGTGRPQGERLYHEAVNALKDAAAQGRINIIGVPAGGTQHEFIRKSTFRSGLIEAYVVDQDRGELGFRLLTRTEPKRVLYDAMLVDLNRVESLWLPKREKPYWERY